MSGPNPSAVVKVRTANRQESEFRFTQLLVELGVAASRNIDLEGILSQSWAASLWIA